MRERWRAVTASPSPGRIEAGVTLRAEVGIEAGPVRVARPLARRHRSPAPSTRPLRRRRLAVPFLVAGLLLGIPRGAATQEAEAETRQELERLRREQERLQEELEALRRELEERAPTPPSEPSEEQLRALRILHELDTRRVDHVLRGIDPEESGFLSVGLFGGKFRIDMSGYLKFDFNWADQQLQDGDLLFLARALRTPLDNSQFTISPRETRFALGIQGPEILGAQSGAKIELDFFGDVGGLDAGANIAQPEPVLRAGFFNLIWSSEDGSRATELLIGQDFLPFGNWFPHLTTFAKGVDVGTYFLLAPQARLIQRWKFGRDAGKELRLSAAVARSISGTFGLAGDLNTGNNFVGIAEQSGLPEFQGSVLYADDFLGTAPFWGVPTPFTISASAVYGQERLLNFAGVPGNDRDIDKWGADVKLFVPILGSRDGNPRGTLSLKGYAAVQENLNEGLGNGLAGIVLEPGGDPTDVEDLEGALAGAGWAELTYYLTNTTYVHAMSGFLSNDRFDAVVEGFAFPTAVGVSGVQDNLRFTVSVKQQIANVLVGLDFTHLETDYMNGATGDVQNALLGFYYFF